MCSQAPTYSSDYHSVLPSLNTRQKPAVVIRFFLLLVGTCQVARLIVSFGSHFPFYQESPPYTWFVLCNIG
jgi:hypothetical protein